MEEFYRFDEDSYAALAAHDVPPLEVTDLLYGVHRFRRHTGAVLQIAGPTRYGRWLGVVLIEEDDDRYLVVGARPLDAAEVATLQGLEER